MSAEALHGVAILRSVAALRATVAGWRAAGARIALVPTMGALHAGHLSLVAAARARCQRVVMSIFVNPTQFAPSEDFAAYPRGFDEDVAKFATAAGDAVFAPGVDTMYATGFATTVTPAGPAVVGLEDRFRPTHFAGVATVVSKLLIQCGPDLALFGEKDFQQLRVIERVARDLDIPAEIGGAPTVREADGLALSSRNVYLAAEERARAPELHRALQRCAMALGAGAAPERACEAARAQLAAAGFDVDYFEARHAGTLAPLAEPGEPVRLLAAARLGRTRLIDNIGL